MIVRRWYHFYFEICTDLGGGLLPCRGNGFALWHLREQSPNISVFNDFQKGIGGVVFQSSHCRGRVEEGTAFSLRNVTISSFLKHLCCVSTKWFLSSNQI